MKRTPIVLLALLLGIALGLYAGYLRWHKPNTTNMMLSWSGKVIPNFKGGDKLLWTRPDGTANQAKILHGGGLCVGDGDGQPRTDCIVRPGVGSGPLRYYPYSCDGCTDPDAGGGTDVQNQQTPTASQQAAANPVRIGVYCEGNTTKLDPPGAVQAGKGKKIYWYPEGNIPANGWSAGPDLTPVCGVASYGDSNAGNGCTVLQTAPATTQYQVTIQSCQAGAATPATVNVQQ